MMANTVNASYMADGLTPLADPSDPEEEIVPLRDATAIGSVRPMSDDHIHSNIQTHTEGIQNAAYNTGGGVININFSNFRHSNDFRHQIHRARDAAFDGFTFTPTSIKVDPSVHRHEYIKRRSVCSRLSGRSQFYAS